jgi:outer membrane receptor for ferrienterochelin and colicin
MRRLRAPLLVVILPVLAGSILSAQTTGSVAGRVTDDTGAGLPGVTVEARGTALQGTQTAITRNDGTYRLTLLPPGTYTVAASLTGFGRAEQAVVVPLDRTVTADFRLRATAREQVVVRGEAPVVDTTSAAVGTNIDARAIESLPSGRNYSSIVQISPGITTQVSNTEPFFNTISVYGSSGLENSFVIDGVDTSGVEYGAQGKELNYEFVQEIDVKTGGYLAEYGRATGGIINVITKSGGNEFHGDAFGYYDSDSLQADNGHPNESLLGTSLGFTREDYGADLGGYVLKDRLWFFGAYDRVHNTVTNRLTSGPNEGEDTDSKSIRNLGAGKLTWRMTESHSFVASFFQDPRVDTGAINDGAHTLNGAFSTFLGRQDFGGQDWSGRYNGLFGSWVASAQLSLHEERNSVGPSTAAGDAIQYVDTRKDGLQSGGFGLIQDKSFKRYFAGVSLTEYLGHHEFKGGFEYERETASVTKRESGGQLVTIFDNPGNPNQPVYQHFYWSVPGASLPNNIPISQLNASPKHKSYAAYLQDSWAVFPNLTANLGVRWDRQQIYDASGTLQIDLKKDYAPRLGLVWDPTKDHRTKVFASFGRFYEQIPMDLVIRSYSFEQQPVIYNFDPVSNKPDDGAAAIAGDVNKVLGGFTEPADPNLHGQYLREFLLGAEREVIPNVAVGVKYVYRNYGEVIEDFLCVNDGTYCVGNPGEGIMKEIFSLDYTRMFPAPKPRRIYRGVQLDVTKRFSDSWSMLASYLWSKLDGNYDGEFAPFTQPRGTADPNISAAYDYYEFFTNGQDVSRITNTGLLSNDRRSQLKISGIYVTPFRLSVGLAAYYRTGTPLTRYGFSNAYSRYEFFLTTRGAEGRVPADYEADLHLGYPLALGPVTVNFLLDVFNLLNAQRPIVLDERYNLAEFDDASYVCGTKPGSDDEKRCNSYYGKPVFRTPPRQLRLGLRVSF